VTSTVIRPYPPQAAFLRCAAYEALVGGSVGGGKTLALLLAAAQQADNRRHRALILRRTYRELEDSLVPASWHVYPGLGGHPKTKTTWKFPSGATVDLRACEHEKDRFKFQGAQWNFLGFDQLEAFPLVTYETICTRLRTTDPTLSCRVRASANPIGQHVDWVLRRWRWWLYEPGKRIEEHPGPYLPANAVVWILREPATGLDRIVNPNSPLICHACGAAWLPSEEAPPTTTEACSHPSCSTRAFFPAKLSDNPALAATDYARRLEQLDPFTRKKLLYGDWMAQQEHGSFFRRAWFGIVSQPPRDARARVRYWDRAATLPRPGKDPDWTVGALVSRTREGITCVEDVKRVRLEPVGVTRLIVETAKEDAELEGPVTRTVLEQDPGQAGKFEASWYVRELAGYDVGVRPVTRSKEARARPLAAQAEAGNVTMVRAPWNDPVLSELEGFPLGVHDDCVDAISGGLAEVSGVGTVGYRGRRTRKAAPWRFSS